MARMVQTVGSRGRKWSLLEMGSVGRSAVAMVVDANVKVARLA